MRRKRGEEEIGSDMEKERRKEKSEFEDLKEDKIHTKKFLMY